MNCYNNNIDHIKTAPYFFPPIIRYMRYYIVCLIVRSAGASSIIAHPRDFSRES